MRLRWLAILHGRVRPSLAVTGGVTNLTDGIKAILAGAHTVQMVSAILRHGPSYFVLMRNHAQSLARTHLWLRRGQMTLRGTDVGARWGGDEFVIVAPNTARAAAYTLAERLLLQVPKEPNAGEAGATISVGVATFDPSHHQSEDAESLMQAADDALHRAKAAGRNQVRVA